MSLARKIKRNMTGEGAPQRMEPRRSIDELARDYWRDKHRWGHTPTEASPAGFEPECYLCVEGQLP